MAENCTAVHHNEPSRITKNTRAVSFDVENNSKIIKRRDNNDILKVRPTMQRLRSGTENEEDFHDHPMNIHAQISSNSNGTNGDKISSSTSSFKRTSWMKQILGQIPAIALICIFHLMIGIPFGVSYFPIGWRANYHNSNHPTPTSINSTAVLSSNDINGPFPIPGKEALGIRMFLFPTIIGQIVFTYKSKFTNSVGLQMVENVPFFQALANIVISEQGYGIESLSTLFFLFGFSSVFVGIVFYSLGKYKLGKVVYFFPSHVLLGLIGGIGIFIAKTGLEVTLNATLKFDMDSFKFIMDHFDLIRVVLLFEIVLRILIWITTDSSTGKQKYQLLSPIYFCMITPIFYLFLWMFQVKLNDAKHHGYFFPSSSDNAHHDCNNEGGLSTSCSATTAVVAKSFLESSFNAEAFVMWRVFNIYTVSWKCIIRSIPILVSLAVFSLIHVPINIPAFAVSTNVEADMNAELIAHGYSNAISGIFGGLQNYMAYTQSVIYARSNGGGKASSLAMVIVSSLLFFIGPTIASFIPRCMAGVLLLHVGIDLFLEGIYDTIEKFDMLEYSGICIIAFIMTTYGMEGAMVTGIISALSTYAIQNITHLNPIRGFMSASTLRSSSMTRCPEAVNILNDQRTGRSRILVIQLQGHLFFGNVAQFTDGITEILDQKKNKNDEPLIVMMDFTLVLGIDSSAAQAIIKIKDGIHKTNQTKVCVFVTGSKDGFPCEFKLTKGLSCNEVYNVDESEHGSLNLSSISENDSNLVDEETFLLETKSNDTARNDLLHSSHKSLGSMQTKNIKNYVTDTLDSALEFAEDILIAFENDQYLTSDTFGLNDTTLLDLSDSTFYLAEEKKAGLRYLNNLSPGQEMVDIEKLFSLLQREEYLKDDIIWKQGSPGDCMKLLIHGSLLSILENEAGTCEPIKRGNTIGELWLVYGMDRMSTVKCVSDKAVLYSLSRETWNMLIETNPKVARIVDMLLIRYLAHRIQHVSNRIFETRCLPI